MEESDKEEQDVVYSDELVKGKESRDLVLLSGREGDRERGSERIELVENGRKRG